MNYFRNIALGVILAITVFCLPTIYGNGLIGFVALTALTFAGIMIIIAANHGN